MTLDETIGDNVFRVLKEHVMNAGTNVDAMFLFGLHAPAVKEYLKGKLPSTIRVISTHRSFADEEFMKHHESLKRRYPHLYEVNLTPEFIRTYMPYQR